MDDDFDGTEVRTDEPITKPADAQSKRKRKREKEKANKQANPLKKTKSGEDEDKEDGGVKLSRPKPSKTVKEKDDGSVNEKFAKMAPSMMADYVGQRLKFWERSLSSVELEDKYIPGWPHASIAVFWGELPLVEERIADCPCRAGIPGHDFLGPAADPRQPAELHGEMLPRRRQGQIPTRPRLRNQGRAPYPYHLCGCVAFVTRGHRNAEISVQERHGSEALCETL